MGFALASGVAPFAGGDLDFIHIERFGGTAFQSFADFGAQIFDLDFAEFFGGFGAVHAQS